ncbi:MAG: hypothetical protein PVG66_02160 [Chromatiales bacterium]|jgi:hypothetical protein
MTDLEVINKRQGMLKYGYIAFGMNAVISIVSPWWPEVAGIDLHILIALGIVLFILYSGYNLSSSVCSNCGKRIFHPWARISGAMLFQHPTSCRHCGAQFGGGD